MTELLPLFVAVPLAGAFVVLLLKGALPRVAAPIALVGTAIPLALALSAALGGAAGALGVGGWGVAGAGEVRFALGIVLVLDGLARLFLLLVGVVSFLVTWFSVRSMESYTGRPLFYSLLLLLVAGMNGAVLAGDLFHLFVFLEVASIASYALVAFGTGAREVEAAFKYLVLGSLASTALLIAIGVLYAATGFLNMANIAVAVGSGGVPAPLLHLAGALLLAGFGIKTAMMPFHAWLPDAHPSAPAPISALLSGLLIKTLGVYAIVRVFDCVLGLDPRIGTLLLVFGSLSMVAGVLLAIGQDDLKRLLAYSSISQMGFVLVALSIHTRLGTAAALFHAFNHGLFKSALFLSSGSLERIAGTRRLSGMGGLFRRAPWTGTGLLASALSISGVPPFNGFWSKLLILVALVQADRIGIAVLTAAAAVLTLITFVRVLRSTVFGPLPDALHDAREVPATMFAPVLVLCLLCLLAGLLWPAGLDDWVASAASAAHDALERGAAAGSYVRLVLGG